MARTTLEEVEAVIDVDSTLWDIKLINNASAFVDRVATRASEQNITVTTDQLKSIETYITAHLYAFKDPQYASKREGRASATFQGKWGMGLEATYWGQFAKSLDPTGLLTTLDEGKKKVTMFHAGKTTHNRTYNPED